MIIDAKTHPQNHLLQYDICVVGSGPASLSFISQFLAHDSKKHARIAVLESGDTVEPIYLNSNELGGISRLYRNIESSVQKLYQGAVSGWLSLNKQNYLTECRLRGYGGTGNIWSGWFCPLEPHDLKRGQWPIEYNELEKYYDAACNLYNLPCFSSLEETKSADLKLPEIYFDKQKVSRHLKPRYLLFKRINFGQIYRDSFINSRHVDLILNANVTGINSCRDNNYISDLEVCVPTSNTNHKTIKVEANNFVIAAGCIETTRLLQLSNIGNHSNLLGKFFQEHFYLWNAGTYRINKIPNELQACYFSKKFWKNIDGTQILAPLVPTEEFLEQKKCNNFRILLGGAPDIPQSINLCWEQKINKNSVISLLKGKKDRYGCNKLIINSPFGQADTETLETAILATRDWLEYQNIGEKFYLPNFSKNPLEWANKNRITPGNHPCGTTRMSTTPSDGVVDPNCKIHNIRNIFICSSSVFPSGGYANPTLTVIALALRLSKHIKKIMSI